MWLTSISIRRPLFILVIVFSLVLMGGIAYSRLGADQYPDINIPYVIVLIPYPGAGPEEVESRVTKVVEDVVAGTSQLKRMQSSSSSGMSMVFLEFSLGADSDTVTSDVERRVSRVRSSLPDETKAPSIIKAEFSSLPIMNVALSGSQSMDELYTLADERVRPRLETIRGVASVRVVGGRQREIVVQVDQDRLRARGMPMQQLVAAIGQANTSIPGGTITEGGKEYPVRYYALYQDPALLRDLVVMSTPAGNVYLRDVAQVIDGYKKASIINRHNGNESIGLLITKQSSANTMEVAKQLRRTIQDLGAGLPSGASLTIATDTSQFVRRSLDDIQSSLFEAVILTGIVLLLFLHTFRSTVIVLFAIPTSMVSTFLVMWGLGFTLNMMSMMALALTVGILVDDSIVVLENIFRHLQLGQTPWAAALEGRNEIGLAAMAITLVDVVVYVPIAFMSGIVGQFFRQFGLTITAATLFSLFVSFTLTPMLASRWLQAEKEGEGRSPLARFGMMWEAGYDRLAAGYGSLLGWSLRHRWAPVLVATMFFVAALSVVPLRLLGAEFMPAEDQAEFIATVEMPPATSLQATDQAVRQFEFRLQQLPEVTSYFTSVGLSSESSVTGTDSRHAMVSIKLLPKTQRLRSLTDITKNVETLADGIPGMEVRTQLPSMAGETGKPIQLQVTGDDITALTKAAAQVEQALRRTPGAVNVTNSAGVPAPEVRVEADQGRLADLGLTPAQVGLAVRTSVEGVVASQFRPEGRSSVDIRVQASDVARSSTEDLPSLPLSTAKGATVNLSQASSVQTVDAPNQVDRLNRQRLVTVGANVQERPLGDVVRDFEAEMRRNPLPPGYKIEQAGQTEMMNETFESMTMAVALSVILMYLLMVALYESLVYPLVIMFSLPVALCGAFAGLMVTHQTLNIASLIGLVMLLGLVGKNAILLVDYTNTLRRQGLDRWTAITRAGPTRLRPILMTTSAMVLAMLPLAVQGTEGSETRSPMAVVVIGGLISSTLLTLVLVPVVYTIFDDLQRRLGFAADWAQGEGVPEREPIPARQ